MSGTAARILLSVKQLDILRKITRSPTVSQRLGQRAQVILLAFERWRNDEIAVEIDLHRRQVGLWRRRWRESFDALVSIECRETHARLRRAIEDVLNDAPRSGAHGKVTAEQITLIITLACEPPKLSGRPVAEWTHAELADEAVKRKIVSSISASQVGHYLRAVKLQPHRSKYWLNTTEKDNDVFQTQVEVVCQTWREAPDRHSSGYWSFHSQHLFRAAARTMRPCRPDLYFQENTHTVSVDEMPGLQALERIAETIPMQPGQPKRIEDEYKRHGTLCLIGNWHVVEGQMICPTIKQTRTESDFAWHIHNTVRTDPRAGWVFVVDNLNVHCSATLVGYVAERGRDRQEHAGKEREVRNSEIQGVSPEVSDRPQSPSSIRFSSEALVVAESD